MQCQGDAVNPHRNPKSLALCTSYKLLRLYKAGVLCKGCPHIIDVACCKTGEQKHETQRRKLCNKSSRRPVREESPSLRSDSVYIVSERNNVYSVLTSPL